MKIPEFRYRAWILLWISSGKAAEIRSERRSRMRMPFCFNFARCRDILTLNNAFFGRWWKLGTVSGCGPHPHFSNMFPTNLVQACFQLHRTVRVPESPSVFKIGLNTTDLPRVLRREFEYSDGLNIFGKSIHEITDVSSRHNHPTCRRYTVSIYND